MGKSASSRIASALRKRWLQIAFALAFLALGYVQGAGLMTRVILQPQFQRLPYATQLHDWVLAFFKPVYLLGGSGSSPNVVTQIIAAYLGHKPDLAGQDLLDLARKEMHAGNVNSAKRIACFVQYLTIEYSLFDDRPDLVLADLARLQGRTDERELLAAWSAPREPDSKQMRLSRSRSTLASAKVPVADWPSDCDVRVPLIEKRSTVFDGNVTTRDGTVPKVVAEAPSTNTRY